MARLSLFALAAALAVGVQAHEDPSTPEAVASYRSLQESAYHCAPQIAAYTAQRKRDVSLQNSLLEPAGLKGRRKGGGSFTSPIR